MNTAQLAILSTEIHSPDYDGMTYEQIVAYLNYQEPSTIPNPTPQTDVPIPVTMMDILEIAYTNDPANTPELVTKLAPIADRFERDLTTRNERAITFYLTVYGAALNAQAQTEIQTLLSTTEPDPTWTEMITVYEPSRASVLGLPEVYTTDVQTALHLSGEN